MKKKIQSIKSKQVKIKIQNESKLLRTYLCEMVIIHNQAAAIPYHPMEVWTKEVWKVK